jgi:hypothetical protein
MSPCETYKSSRPAVDARARSTASSHLRSDYIPEGDFDDDSEYECDSIANSDDSDAVPDSDHDSDYESDSDDCWCGTCDLPRRPRRDFKKREVIGTPQTLQWTVWGHAARDNTLARRKSRCEISQAERQSNTSQKPPHSDRPNIRRPVSRRQSIVSTSQTRRNTLRNCLRTESSPPTSSIGGVHRGQEVQASERGMYDDATPAGYEESGPVEEAKAQGYFDHGVDAWK